MREFRNVSRTGKTRVWKIDVQGDQVVTEYGDLEGIMQKVSDTAKAKNIGRANEVSPEAAAVEMADREILLKTRAGYTELNGAAPTPPLVGTAPSFDFMKPPTNLSFYKPDNTLSARLLQLLDNGGAWLSRKRDGEMMAVFIDGDGEPRILSRKMLPSHHLETVPWADRFPHLMKSLREAELPPHSVLLGEMVMDRNGSDDRWAMASVMKSKTPEALALQEKNGRLSYYIWDIAFWCGRDLISTSTVADRYELLALTFGYEDPIYSHLLAVDVLASSSACISEVTPEEYQRWEGHNPEMGHTWNAACFLAHGAGWEGWVVVDPQGVYGDKAWNLRGKTDRPGKFCGKLKPELEDDFLAEWDPANGIGEFGSGKYQGLVGAVDLYQFNSAGEKVYICQCGNGFDEAFLKANSTPECFPMVVTIKYSSRTYMSKGAKTNALQFPSLSEVRLGKASEECVNIRL